MGTQAFRCAVDALHYLVVYANNEAEAVERATELFPKSEPAPRRLPWLDDKFEVGHFDIFDRQIDLRVRRSALT